MIRALRTRSLRAQVVRTARMLEHHGLVISSVGNVSARCGQRLWITPTKTPYATMRASAIVEVDLEDAEGSPRASRELPLHRAVYASRRDVAAVVHTHSVHASAWSFLQRPLEPATEDLAYWDIRVVTTTYAAPGSGELAATAGDAVRDGASAALLGGHGVLAVGATLDRALLVARVVERQAQIAWLLHGAASASGPLMFRRPSVLATDATPWPNPCV
jgi:L-fuculose-phosphate aldolase